MPDRPQPIRPKPIDPILRPAPKPYRRPWLVRNGWQPISGMFIGIGFYALTWGRSPLWGVALVGAGAWTAWKFWEV